MAMKNVEAVSNEELYEDFCLKHNIQPLSFSDLATALNIPINQLKFSIKGMILYYPERFKQIHCEVGVYNK